MLDPDRYFTNDLDFLKTRYVDVVTQISALNRQRYDAVIAERKGRFHLYATCPILPGARDSHAARERFADVGTLAEWLIVKDCDYQLQDLLEEKEFLLHLISWQHGLR